ncbi:MAG: tRNA (adenosine(37)-N6)-threonylcarbamoyltransferase complex dimerization subunit type 1 TsaB [Paludibacteraceae bacterium]|nr:tRNA (adenosine(37)-N6)-threonylcarbamoyltransferase complex dimerization subunit type 1 TsaB [Paludibacteraceae bacterium]MBN2787583.1 tRNA (adenosine(37)-N6)-threonylcarbamoyltransferase complex dimerization subunit type 1 TsaB [Paludibacteraceae bacterium]
MPVILLIETSTTVCSVALSKNGACIAEKVNFDGPSHATLLGVYVQEMLAYSKQNNVTIDAVAISCGPGSYTGLRIGVSTAKGLCFGLGIPLIAIPTLQLLASTVKESQTIAPKTLLCPMLDARRMEVYTAFYDHNLQPIRKTAADIIDEQSYSDLLNNQPILFFGNGADKCKATLTHPNATFLNEIYPIAKNMIILAEASYEVQRFEDVAYFEPFYLKEFVATTPKEKL